MNLTRELLGSRVNEFDSVAYQKQQERESAEAERLKALDERIKSIPIKKKYKAGGQFLRLRNRKSKR